MSAISKSIIKHIRLNIPSGYNLSSIFHTFNYCSKDLTNNRYLVDSTVKCINFDKLTQWFYTESVPHSADSLSFADDKIIFIEFKSGDQIGMTQKSDKLIKNASYKINDSYATLYEKVLSTIADFHISDVKFCFFLVVDTKEMGITPMISTLASLSEGASVFDNPNMEAMLTKVRPSLKSIPGVSDKYEIIDIWYSELFTQHLNAFKIVDIESLQ